MRGVSDACHPDIICIRLPPEPRNPPTWEPALSRSRPLPVPVLNRIRQTWVPSHSHQMPESNYNHRMPVRIQNHSHLRRYGLVGHSQ